MIHILLATHGKLAEGLLDSAKMVYGELAQTSFVSLRNEGGIESFKREFAQEIERQNQYVDGILVLCDLQSGTPYNVACCHAFSPDSVKPIAVICGVNFPMLLMSMDFVDSDDVHFVAKTLVTQAAESMIYAQPPQVAPDEEF
ncbi:PTS sugar transporter subunit IIA [Yersinia aleksiciae]|uniref:PTS fructose transporter subunit IIA n=1 Tax=Yersinia aleksiciae TaxID=263819 RepID=A0A0T9UFY4_YERAE|nr:PTS fructose transporter subunit IIA [Yersinia aleksiciae]AKP34649.1 PTS fructose transporter subunit IIA [Yersinia aleksiciae]MDA5499257.1 PTS fructose transporter subunit IIA [Yersinia aleksiciae]NIK99158.1 PTS fructose transporter subunit IIA [Yersinia aleksiciae]WQC69721.1 PTS fructose transporter subunit IIA [Yersinia aleksiciae]CFQ47283.1 sorbose-specific PTS uptake system component [Yersinia aleksiciae]